MKIYAASVEALRKRGRGGQNRMKLSLLSKKWCISEFHPLLKANVLLFQVKIKSHSVLDQIHSSGAVFS
jgi:hypothetical protein